MDITRRPILGTAAGGGVAAAAGGTRLSLGDAAAAAPLPNPDASGIEHVLVLIMENRSFDHMLGWLPGADGRQGGLSFRDR